MAKIQQPFACDLCSQQKREVNKWFLAWAESPGTEAVKLLIVKWDDELAEQAHVKHICGIECCQRWLAKELDKINGN